MAFVEFSSFFLVGWDNFRLMERLDSPEVPSKREKAVCRYSKWQLFGVTKPQKRLSLEIFRGTSGESCLAESDLLCPSKSLFFFFFPTVFSS